MLAYSAENKQYLPASYNYRGTTVDDTGNQTPAGAAYGYIHWSSLLMGNVNPDAFKCPAIANGGLAATDPQPGNFDAGQTVDTANTGGALPPDQVGRVTPVTANGSTYYPDSQAARMAYTLNEALCGRNKYVVGFQGGKRTYRNVQISEIANQAGTILATEFVDEWGIVSGVDRGGGSAQVCKSHRPVSPYREDSTANGDAKCDPSAIDTTSKLRKTYATDLWLNSDNSHSLDIIKDYGAGKYTAAGRGSRLDWVGRNHGNGEKPTDNKSNFLYLDGHVETKSILETLPKDSTVQTPWEWGDRPYSTSPNAVNP
jgi:prepilin-type processing-associated H-X9-DG protein